MKTNNVDFGKSFKFKHKNHSKDADVIYTYNKPESNSSASKVTWGKNRWYESGYCMYSVKVARRLVEEGIWIVLPSDTKEILGESPYPIKFDTGSLLDQIKHFTATSKHSVNVYEGVYEVFRSGEDMAYKCKDDEQLRSVMQALSVLDGVNRE